MADGDEEPSRCRGVPTLRIAKFSDSRTVTVEVAGTTLSLTRAEAIELRETLAASLTAEREFVHTVGTHRADGSYVVARRRADSDGHRKVFESFDALARRFDAFPERFVAADLDGPGISGGRRHLVVRHLVEHPAFPCELERRQPLTARKTG